MSTIAIHGARLHNLQNLSLELPKNRLVVFTGLSGSGKSTLAFDTLHKEGQRQYMESLGLVTDALSRPPITAIAGLSPSISVGQNLTNRSPRSTVGTATEVYTYLRVLFARVGRRACPACGAHVSPLDHQGGNGYDDWEDEVEGGDPQETFPCPACGAPVPEVGMAHFSFNKPAGACPTCTGLGTVHQVNLHRLIDQQRSILDGAVHGWDDFLIQHNSNTLRAAGRHYGFVFDPALPVQELGPVQRDLLLYGVGSPQFRQHTPGVKPPTTVRQGQFEGVVTNLMRRYVEHAHDAAYREKLDAFLETEVCPACQGTRLRPEARQVTVAGQGIVDVSRLPLTGLADWLARLPAVLSSDEMLVGEPIVADLSERVRRLVDVGVGYLTLERSSPTLSAGEAQRLRLAALLGSGLTGVLYVLDEPTIGLHPSDTSRLIQVLRRLRDLGNTVLVVEHDPEMIRAADHVVDFGPGAGKHGGRVVAAGTPAAVMDCPASLTGAYLAGRLAVPVPEQRRKGNGRWLTIHGAGEHNLKDITVRLPLGTLIAVTGVSGSGKSSLLFDILDRAARQRFYGAGERPGKYQSIEGWEGLDKIVTIDQTPIGRVPRSNAATYTDVFTAIRQAFAATPEARQRQLAARHFSFNVPGGRCERCEGAGTLLVKMHFLPDVQVRCPACHGRRFKRNVLSIPFRGRDIAQVLDMTVDEVLDLFAGEVAVARRLELLVEVGLGYLQLGQPATTLSGGEAQRVKLAKELGRRSTGRTLYLLDEPSTGLHMADAARLLAVLLRLVDAGNTVVVIEHNLDLIRAADWIVDLGPGGGRAGGQVVAEGTPEQVAQVEASVTGAFLRPLAGKPEVKL